MGWSWWGKKKIGRTKSGVCESKVVVPHYHLRYGEKSKGQIQKEIKANLKGTEGVPNDNFVFD